jgi:transcription antitermination factor NusG
MIGASATRDLAPIRTADGACWFAVWTRSQCEPKVEEVLQRKGLEVFLPRVRVASRRRDRRLILARPLFPGYVFLHFAPSRDAYIRVASTEGVVRILGERWDSLHRIPDEQLEAIQRIVVSGDRVRAVPWIKAGDRVRVVAGVLAGLEGFVRSYHAGRATFVVSIDLLQRSVAAEVAAEVVERV